ncbi:MAG: Glu-tRNA(Gln) amidotransferase subunit GatE [Candidatus Thermoplasmatota archaeon]|nr:Glu-tRNA(Gln) amidotransferase subunit GatE [Candidatus Thermoplasmatota archaeon]
MGLRVGLEVHRQLIGSKLFCNCSGELEDREVHRIRRRLGLSRSETGDIDRAASLEIGKTKQVFYSITENSCLVEIDEEPPKMPDRATLDAALMISMLLGSHIPDEILFMRKIVVDGSNPAGFQRTGIVGTGGQYTTESGHELFIDTVCLEEDAARKMDTEDGTLLYRVDRLGIPEIEISTKPDISSPETARDVASSIGKTLRSTGKVRRGIGTIRQDVNVSVEGGNRVELKLVQDLRTIPKLVKMEAIRQMLLVEMSRSLKDNGSPPNIPLEIIDISDIFRSTNSRVLRTQIAKGGKVLSLPLRNLAGYFGTRERHGRVRGRPLSEIRKGIDDVKRLGPEIAAYAKVRTGIKGLFHSDELPDYGVSEEEVREVYSALGLDRDNDALVLVCAPRDVATRALEAVHERVLLAYEGVPGEVRRTLDDCRTEYMRPLPGSARMYPETDIPPIRIEPSDLELIKADLPEPREERVRRIAHETGLSQELISQLNDLELIERFEALVSGGGDPKLLSRILINIIPNLPPRDQGSRELSDQGILSIVKQVSSGKMAKEAMDDIVPMLTKRIGNGEDEGVALKGVLDQISMDGDVMTELSIFIQTLVQEKKDLILDRELRAVGPLMGEVMKVFRGKVDGRMISEMLNREIGRMVGDR